MKSFIVAFITAALLFGLYVGFNYGVCYLGGEMLSFAQVMDRLEADPDLIYGSMYNNDYQSYKKQLYSRIKPKLVVAGSSRTLHHTADLYVPKMANCGLSIKSIHSLRHFFNHMRREGLPETLILGIDHWWLNEEIEALPSREPHSTGDEITFDKLFSTIDYCLKGTIDVLTLPANSIILRGENSRTDALGFRGIYKDGGFRADGSVRENKDVLPGYKELTDFEKAGIKLIKSQPRSYRYGRELHMRTIEAFFEEIQRLREDGVNVIAYIPPLAPEYYQYVTQHKKFAYVKKVTDLMAEKYGVYNFIDPNSLQLSSSDFFDLIHTRPGVTGKILLRLTELEPGLGSLINMQAVRDRITNNPQR